MIFKICGLFLKAISFQDWVEITVMLGCSEQLAKAAMMHERPKRNRAAEKMNPFTTLPEFWNYDSPNLFSEKDLIL